MGRFHVQLCCFYIGVNSTVKKGIIQNQLTKIHLALVYRDVAKSSLPTNFHRLKEILSPDEISTEHKYLRLILTLYSPKGPAGFINESGKVLKQSRTQSPQALWPAVGRLERLRGIRKKRLIGCTVKASIILTQKSCGNKIPARQHLSRRITTGQRVKEPEDSGHEIGYKGATTS